MAAIKCASVLPRLMPLAKPVACFVTGSFFQIKTGPTIPGYSRSIWSLDRPIRHHKSAPASIKPKRRPYASPCCYSTSTIATHDQASDASSSTLGFTNRTCDIKVVDYSAQRLVQHEPSKDSLLTLLKDNKKPEWAASRWIYVNGLDRDVIRCLGENSMLHKLAMEDVMETGTPAKVDWYSDHCFVVMTLQKLVPHLPTPMYHRGRSARRSVMINPAQYIMCEQVSMFLTSDNTVITIFDKSGPEIFDEVKTRLESTQTIVRSSNDPSLLLHAVVDAIVDISEPIGKAFGETFHDLETSVLMNPTIAQSTKLYELRSNLTLLGDIVIPIRSVVGGLRDHCAVPDPNSPKPLISPVARTYFSDVHDHVNMLSRSTHTLVRSTENLTGLIFSTISAKQNESVRQLTLVSLFFLPLTFLTGYFGMNFDPMPIVNDNSDGVFWVIAVPVMMTSALFVITRAVWSRSLLWMRQRRAMQHRHRPRRAN